MNIWSILNNGWGEIIYIWTNGVKLWIRIKSFLTGSGNFFSSHFFILSISFIFVFKSEADWWNYITFLIQFFLSRSFFCIDQSFDSNIVFLHLILSWSWSGSKFFPMETHDPNTLLLVKNPADLYNITNVKNIT